MNEAIKLLSLNKLTINLCNRHVATLIGLRNLRVNIISVTCVDDVTKDNREQVFALEKWLKKNHFPRLQFNTFSSQNFEEAESSLCEHLLKTWKWTDKDCDFVVRLESLPNF